MRFRRRSRARKRLLRRLFCLAIIASAVGYPAADAHAMEGAMFSTSFDRVEYLPGLYVEPEDELIAAGEFSLADLNYSIRAHRDYYTRYNLYRPAGMR